MFYNRDKYGEIVPQGWSCFIQGYCQGNQYICNDWFTAWNRNKKYSAETQGTSWGIHWIKSFICYNTCSLAWRSICPSCCQGNDKCISSCWCVANGCRCRSCFRIHWRGTRKAFKWCYHWKRRGYICQNIKPLLVGLFAGKSPLTGKIGLKFEPGSSLGICTSSGTVGHSLSFGKCDAVYCFPIMLQMLQQQQQEI